MTKVEIDTLKPDISINEFDCGVSTINDYLKRAKEDETDRLTKVYVASIEKRAIGYIAVFCSHFYLSPKDIPELKQSLRVPGICLGKIAIDIKYQNKGIGTLLLKKCIAVAEKINYWSACRIIYNKLLIFSSSAYL